jgi:hypothetical protein
MEARRSGGAKKGQQWTEGSETGTEKIGRNYKKKKKKPKKKNRLKKKVIQQNTKTNTWTEEAGEEEKGWGAPGLGTSGELLELGVKRMWGGGMMEAIPPPLPLRCSGRGVVAGLS